MLACELIKPVKALLRPNAPPPEPVSDICWLLAAASAFMFAGSFFLKRNEPGKAGNVSVH
jgi:hypothetical protein